MRIKSILILFILLGLNFVSFRALQQNDADRVLSTIASILRKESVTANTYVLAKSFSDIESLGILTCSIVEDVKTERRIFYDTSANEWCVLNTWLEIFNSSNANIRSINGVSFNLKVQPKLDISKIVLETLIYFLIVIGFWQVNRVIKNGHLILDARIKAIELEKQLMQEHTKQIRHDVASPISAMNMIIGLIPALDPEVRSALKNALARTQELFDELNRGASLIKKETNGALELDLVPISVPSVLKEIFDEKRMLHASQQNLNMVLDQQVEDSEAIMGNIQELKRILSNLINNSFEALESGSGNITIGSRSENGTISIFIMDDGKGMSPDFVAQIGAKGLTLGKEDLVDSGSGIGLYHAKKSIEVWGGKLVIQSSVGVGTIVQIQLPRYHQS